MLKKRSEKVGLSPGTPVYLGSPQVEEVKITVMDYNEQRVKEEEIKMVKDVVTLKALKDKPTVTWINVEGIDNIEVIQTIGQYYELHPLIIEDILATDQRPKMEDHESYIYIVLRMLSLVNHSTEIVGEQVSIILGKNFVISFQEGKKGDVFNPVRERIRNGKGRTRKRGADYLAYSLIDAIVDHYFVILEQLEDHIEIVEDEVVEKPTPETSRKIHQLKRELILLRKSIWPVREVVGGLQRGDSPIIQKTTQEYLRDVYDHTIEVMDSIETFRDIGAGMLDVYLSSVSNRLNEVMKVLTVITTIFMPLSFIAGVYGMNFRHMPELEHPYGYLVVIVVMLTIGTAMLLYFIKRKWL